MVDNNNKGEVVCFQDVVLFESSNERKMRSKEEEEEERDEGYDDNDRIATAFFDLANSPSIKYRISSSSEIIIKQDMNACGNHTGGIVWETSYLLLNYLREIHQHTNINNNNSNPSSSSSSSCIRTLLEVGAGCGLVGFGVHKCNIAKKVIITECNEVMDNLLTNWKLNYSTTTTSSSRDEKIISSNNDDDKSTLKICELDWNTYRQDCKRSNIQKHTIDMIVGTDVVFSTILVEPLLKTMKYLSHDETIIYLCLQERCKDSHDLLLNKAIDYNFHIQDITTDYLQYTSCKWGKELDCCLLKFTVIVNNNNQKKRKRT